MTRPQCKCGGNGKVRSDSKIWCHPCWQGREPFNPAIIALFLLCCAPFYVFMPILVGLYLVIIKGY